MSAVIDLAEGLKKLSSAATLEQGLVQIAAVIENDAHTRNAAVQGGVIAHIASALERSDVSADVVAAAFKCTWYLARSSEHRTALGEQLAAGLLSSLRRFGSNPTVQQFGCGAVSNLSSGNKANKIVLGKAGAIEAIVDAMRTFADSEVHQEFGLSALRNLGNENENQERCLAAHALEAIYAAMTGFKSSSKIQEIALAVITNISSSAKVKLEVVKTKGHELIIGAMNQHENAARLQENGCAALASLAAHRENRRSLGVAKAIPALFKAMSVHKDEAGVQEQACHALWNQSLQKKSRYVIADKGGLPLVLTALETHRKDAKVIEEALGAVWNLSREKLVCERLNGDVGSVDLVINAMRANLSSANVQRNALGAIENLAVTKANQKLLAERGIIPIIFEITKIHHKSPVVLDKLSGAIGNLSHRSENRQSLIDLGLVPLFLNSVMAIKSRRLHEGSLRALLSLSFHPLAIEQMFQNKGLNFILATTQGSLKSKSVCLTASALLANVCISEGARDKLVLDGGLEIVMKLVKTGHEKGHVGLIENCFRLLINIGVSEYNILAMYKMEFEPILHDARDRFPDNKFLHGLSANNFMNGLHYAGTVAK